ncbi:hypothetical protein Back11_24750 [Paenibacillus baekrokdamisoli]|uniref:Uncharacterized protein n=1 Tax=Paenibacillus baekrokdamisoli TaxID=1712516 RepID=A0A3G9IQJ1_9BACL|nr:YqhR family membrane protein [Paenibacillus baekrokdamisoli]MBB3070118.1 hypothetical protein [Paenibacillus baekrokdamisoli]BBH21130.1 hypothetical protein Back11_24750 [Paenibacillus baekrokdamisoli]
MQSDHSKLKRYTSHPKKRQEHRTNSFWFCVKTGFFAGLIWGLLRWLLHAMQFTKVLPAFMADPFFRLAFLKTGWGNVVGIGCFIIFSIIAALLYKLLLGRFSGPRAGIGYGMIWWVILFAWIGPIMAITKPIYKLDWDSIVTELAVFTVWGLFIGYTIAFEFTDEVSREPIGAN